MDAAVASYRKAIELDPKYAMAHNNLGSALGAKGQLDAAMASFDKAIELDSKYAMAHNNLGNALHRKGQLDAAIVSYRKAIELDPKFAGAHSNLGNALKDKGQLDAAIASYRKAIELDPKLALAHGNLGIALAAKGQLDEAIVSFRKAIELDPKLAAAHSNLGNALSDKGQLDAAIASYRKAIELDPKLAGARNGLAEAERLAALQGKLPALLKGDFKPTTNDERVALSRLCTIKKLYRTSAGLSADAFAADHKLADDLRASHRYNAACFASLAAAGKGEDAAKLDDKEKARLRKQALDWLRADLALWTKLNDSGPPAARAAMLPMMKHWQRDSDLAGIRDAASLAKLPAEERTACEKLWSDVASLLKMAEDKPK